MAKPRKPKRKKPLNPAQGKALFLTHYRAGEFDQALQVARKLIAGGMRHSNLYSDAAVASVYLFKWKDAIQYAKQATALDPRNLSAWDSLAHAYGAVYDWENTAKAGLQALNIRKDSMAEIAPVSTPLAQKPESATKNVIAFSLFGGSSKYCETAVLNCLEQPSLYPDWICRFYVDDSVPEAITKRLTDAGGEVILVSGGMDKWPGPMWRFAAYDAPDVQRVIFRDADSVISKREAEAVREWINSGQSFHAMRDGGSHTELLLAGLWGVVKGALPPMAQMIESFLENPPKNAHFADQFFLRQFIWPFARDDIFQHDSLFGFMRGRPFPEGPHRDDFHVGYAEGSPFLTITSDLPNGSAVVWEVYETANQGGKSICRYPALVEDGIVKAHVPARYARKIQSQDWGARILSN